MNENWFKSFITHNTKYCLLDSDKEIRATAFDLEGIQKAKQYFGWGEIHKLKLEKDKIVIGKREVK